MIDSRHRTEVAQPGSSRPPAEATPQPAFFLRTKLAPPRPAPALLPRPRLMERLAANLSRTVTLVTANAGAGKTTLVADFVREYAPRFVWYQLDHTDADPAVFLSYIAYRSEEHTSELQSLRHLVCRLLLEKKKYNK